MMVARSLDAAAASRASISVSAVSVPDFRKSL